jgi:multidrug transporter EmrE-like cation transporter
LNWSWLFLAVAIVCEVVATTALKSSEDMSRIVPSAIALAGYGIAFFCLSRALQTIPLGVSYAIWSGVGIVALTLIGLVVYRQALSAWGGPIPSGRDRNQLAELNADQRSTPNQDSL